MADATFTPGPWEALFDKRRDNYSIFGGASKGTRHWIANTKCESTPRDHAANALLMAAAPDLYEALYRLVRDCEIAGLQEQAGFDCWISMANAALAKARGEK